MSVSLEMNVNVSVSDSGSRATQIIPAWAPASPLTLPIFFAVLFYHTTFSSLRYHLPGAEKLCLTFMNLFHNVGRHAGWDSEAKVSSHFRSYKAAHRNQINMMMHEQIHGEQVPFPGGVLHNH